MWSLFRVDRYELAWAAGFFDGEGWAGAARHGRGDERRPHARVNQAGSDGVPETLLRFQRALGGLGRIGGPQVQPGRRDLYRWEASSRGDVELLHHLLLPWLGQVKLVAFANAVGRTPAAAQAKVHCSTEWVAWAAGLYDGEGSAYLREHRTHDGYVIAEVALTQSGRAEPPEVLRRLLGIVGVGHINGPYTQERATLEVYRWKVQAQADVSRALELLLPWLGEVKREQTSAVLEALRQQAPLPRGNPEWGNRKTRCVNGHEYATARIRPFVPRKGGTERRDSSGCLACLRDYARRKREEKKRSATDDGGRSISDEATSYLLK